MYKVKKIKDKGRGVIATEDICKGAIIMQNNTLIIPKSEDIYNTIISRYIFASTNKTILALGDISLINHSDKPNAKVIYDRNTLYLVSTKSIPVNTEITIEYTTNKSDLFSHYNIPSQYI